MTRDLCMDTWTILAGPNEIGGYAKVVLTCEQSANHSSASPRVHHSGTLIGKDADGQPSRATVSW